MIQIFNNQIFFFFYNLSHKSFILDWWIIFFAHTFPYIVIILSIIFLLFHHEVILLKYKTKNEAIWNSFRELKQKWKEIVLVFFSGVFAWCVASLIKIIIKEPRPHMVFENVIPLLNKIDYSFPSGHATFFMGIAFAIFFSHKKAGYVFMFFALIIGITRIITGVHFPIDIITGFILGAIIAYFVKLAYSKLN